jgi:hypothetical protein
MISVAPPPLQPFAGSGNQQLVSTVEVPSGQSLELHEVLVDNVGPEKWMRFRFLAPAIGKQPGDKSFADVEDDFAYLCTALALPYLKEFGLSADVVAVSFLSEPVPFGESDPDVTQFVEVFRVSTGVCEWEGF